MIGLVYSSTSEPLPGSFPERLRVVHQESRVKRLQKGTLTAARLMQQRLSSNGSRTRVAMLTLTYRDNVGWQRDHIANFRKALRHFLKRRKITPRFVWVMELTQRGRPHYHMLIWLPVGVTLPKPDKRGWWPHGLTRIEWAKNAVGYIAKYASKADATHKFPKGARIHGVGGLEVEDRNVRTWWLSPKWVRDHWPNPQDKPRSAPGGGYVSRVLGDWLPSPWLVEFEHGALYIRKREGI